MTFRWRWRAVGVVIAASGLAACSSAAPEVPAASTGAPPSVVGSAAPSSAGTPSSSSPGVTSASPAPATSGTTGVGLTPGPPSAQGTAGQPPSGPLGAPDTTEPPVALDESAAAVDIVVAIDDIKAVQAKAQGPGEVSGPGLQVRVTVTNTTSKDYDTTSLLVTMLDAAENPAAEMMGPPTDPITGTLQPGESATGTYVFQVPSDRRRPVKVLVTLPTRSPVLLFEGDAPTT